MVAVMRRTKSIIVLSLGLISTVVATTVLLLGESRAGDAPLPSALDRERVPSDVLPGPSAEKLAARGFHPSTSRRVADGVYIAEREGGRLCYLVDTAGGLSGGCAFATDFFNGKAIVFGVGQSGKPDAPSSVTVAGVARPGIELVRIHFGPIFRSVEVSRDGGFIYSADSKALEASPVTSVEAIGRGGRVIAAYPVPVN